MNDQSFMPQGATIPWSRRAFYRLKPLIPRSLQLALRRYRARRILQGASDTWPIDPACAKPPTQWEGWPDGKQFAFVLTHDVESALGHERCMALADLEMAVGVRSSFNFVPERYAVSSAVRERLTSKGFEVGVHGLRHDGRDFESAATFRQRALRINGYLSNWQAVGFRAPCMHHNLEWIGHLKIEYDASTFDTDPFEPQPDGARTIYPFMVRSTARTYVELPYTLPQDHTVFVVLGESSGRIWHRKLDWIVEQGGMALICTHPDYMHFGGGRAAGEEYPAKHYQRFLEYALKRYGSQCWLSLPREMARYWRRRYRAVVSALAGNWLWLEQWSIDVLSLCPA